MSSSKSMRALVVAAACGSVAGCESGAGQTIDRAPPAVAAGVVGTQRDTEVLGTIEANLDGEPRTWYVVAGSSRGRPYASAMWMQVGDEDSRMVVAGGFDTDDPPIDTFEFEAGSGNVSYGDYTGSSFAITLGVPAGTNSLRVHLPRRWGCIAGPAVVAAGNLSSRVSRETRCPRRRHYGYTVGRSVKPLLGV